MGCIRSAEFGVFVNCDQLLGPLLVKPILAPFSFPNLELSDGKLRGRPIFGLLHVGARFCIKDIITCHPSITLVCA